MTDKKNTVHELFNQAYYNFQHENLDEALSCCQNILLFEPNYEKAHQLSSIIFISKVQYKEAIETLQKSISLFPYNYDLQFNLAYCYQQLKEYNLAIQYYENLISNDYKLDSVLFNIAVINSNLMLYSKAEKYYEQLLEKYPEHEHGLYNYANLLQNFNEYKKAIIIYEKLLAINDKFTKVWNNLGRSHQNVGDFEKAFQCYEKQIETEPNNAESYNNLGTIFLFLNNNKNAKSNFKKALDINPKHIAAYKNLSQIAMHENDFKLAKHYLNKALSLDANDITAKYLLQAISGENITKPPDNYISELFDQYANSFDEHLLNKLYYMVPDKIISLIQNNIDIVNIKSVLDLGCGTGLMLEKLSNYFSFNRTVGVDISQNMLNFAESKNLYDELLQAEICKYLEINEDKFDLIIAADVLPYMGDLNNIFSGIKKSLNNNGFFVFSVENNTLLDDDYVLTKKGRFTHNINYIKNLATTHNLYVKDTKYHSLRKDGNYTVPGISVCIQYNL